MKKWGRKAKKLTKKKRFTTQKRNVDLRVGF